jgi:allophanate hydrolase
MYRLEELRAQADRQWRGMDVLLLPTVTSIPSLAQVAAEPRAANDRLGIYTRFANLLGCCVTAVPTGMRANGLPFGVSLVAPGGADAMLDAIAPRLQARAGCKLGVTGHGVPVPTVLPPSAIARETLPIAVVGAHLSGMPLNHQLTERGATLARTARTSPHYRLYALPNTEPRKPGLVRVADGGAAIEVEIWRMPIEHVGSFLACVPSPLVIGTLELEDGALVKGFLCEAHALAGALDITAHGGFRRYVATLT